jgi:hypothetical protein
MVRHVTIGGFRYSAHSGAKFNEILLKTSGNVPGAGVGGE